MKLVNLLNIDRMYLIVLIYHINFELQVLELSRELDEYRHSVPDLEDKVVGLQAETEAQDKALRYVWNFTFIYTLWE